MSVDDRLRAELRRLSPADPSGAFGRVVEKRVRRQILRKVRFMSLAIVVILGSISGFYGLTKVFRSGGEPAPLGSSVSNGLLALSLSDSDRTGSHLVTLAPDGSALQRLTTGDSKDFSAAWSPDGRSLAFWRVGSGVQSGIYVMNLDDESATLVHPTSASIWAIRWSPDGKRIAYVSVEIPQGPSNELDLSEDLDVMNADGSDVTPVITYGQVNDFDWSPDGTQFAIERQYGIGPNKLATDLAVVNADGTDERPLTDDGSSRDPTWSPDGSTIVFVDSVNGDARSGELFAVAPDGRERKQLTMGHGDVEDPVFAPDGSLVAYTRFPNADGSACDLVVMSPDGTEARSIATKESLVGCPTELAWQPVPAGLGTVTISLAPPLTDIGLGFPVCNVQTIEGDFDGEGRTDEAIVATKVSDTGSCPDVGKDTRVLAIDLGTDGTVDALYEPLACDPWCFPFAAPDLDGDGRDELVLDEGHLVAPVSAELRVYEVSDDGSSVTPVAFEGGPDRFHWGSGQGGAWAAGAICTAPTQLGTNDLTTWEATSIDGGVTYDLVERTYRLTTSSDPSGRTFALVSRDERHVGWDGIPKGLTRTLCGSPVAEIG